MNNIYLLSSKPKTQCKVNYNQKKNLISIIVEYNVN